MSTRALSKELSSLAETWTRDPFRSNLQLSSFLKSLATHPRLTKRAVKDARSLQNNEMMKKYPLSEKMLRPASKPMYYERLVQGYEQSAQGIRRPWWKVFFGICLPAFNAKPVTATGASQRDSFSLGHAAAQLHWYREWSMDFTADHRMSKLLGVIDPAKPIGSNLNQTYTQPA